MNDVVVSGWCNSLKEELKSNLYSALKARPDLDPNRAKYIQKFISIIDESRVFFKNNTLKASITKLIDDIDYIKFIESQHEGNILQADARKADIENFIYSAEKFQTNFNTDQSKYLS